MRSANDLSSRLAKNYEEVEELLSAKDPETQPFKSKYAAREKISAMLNEIDDSGFGDESRWVAATAGCYSALGCIDMDVQELPEAESHFKEALRIAESVTISTASHIIFTKIKTRNQLGILWCMRDNSKKAELYLEEAMKLYETFTKEPEGGGCRDPAFTLKDLLTSENLESSFENDKALELLNAHTHYFLAQVYQKTQRFELSAKCCHTTLAKQLAMKEYQALEWAKNAATLSHHYTVHERFREAKIHLAASEYVIGRYTKDLETKEFECEEDRSEANEVVAQISADVAKSWGKFALVLLEASVEAADREAHPPCESHVEDLEENGAEGDTELGYEVDFPTIELDPAWTSDVRHTKAKTFEDAREIFLAGQRALNRAKTFYTLNDHCTDFAEIQQDLSRMHKVLIYFEPEEDRQFKMHKRRIDLLESVYKELNPQVYKLLCRQLIFEMGETYSAMMDLKSAKLRRVGGSSPPAALVAKTNALVELSVNSFKQFLTLLKTSPDAEMPKKFDKDVCRPALLAHFHLGRLSDKYQGMSDDGGGPSKIAAKLETLRYFKFVVEYCDKNPEAQELFQSELVICRELVQLLPVKIRKMQAEYNSGNHNR